MRYALSILSATFVLALLSATMASPGIADVRDPLDVPLESEAEVGDDYAPPTPVVTTPEAVAAAKTLISGTRDAVVLAGALAVLLRFLLALGAKAATYFTSTRYHNGYRVAALVATPILAFLAHYAGGAGWPDAIVVALSGPGAIAFNELLKMWPTKEPAALDDDDLPTPTTTAPA